MAPRPADLPQEQLGARIATASVLAAIGLIAVLVGSWLWTLLLLAVLLGTAFELARLIERQRRQQQRYAVAVASLSVFFVLSVALLGPLTAVILLALLLPVGCGLFALAGGNALRLGGGVLYLAIPFACLIWLRLAAPDGLLTTLWLLLVVAATDTGAYVVGRTVGGPRLAPALSPGKTWAGLVGGMVAAAATGGLMVGVSHGHEPTLVLFFALMAAILAIIAQAGDLTESWLKRRSGFKDSGRLLPGHGGLLDRFDGLLFAAPVYTLMVSVLTDGPNP